MNTKHLKSQAAEVGSEPRLHEDAFDKKVQSAMKPRKYEIAWKYVVWHIILHVSGFYGMYLFLTGGCKWQSLLYMIFYYNCSSLGVTAGVHRLWSHNSYKAKWPLRLMLMIFQTQSFQEPITTWVKLHRVHHKYIDTDADPYNALRGFWFSHYGWTVTKRTPEYNEALAKLDFSDLFNDRLVMFQKKHYKKLVALLTFIVPTLIPFCFWGESVRNAFFFCACFNWVCITTTAYSINSFAHIWGSKPYDTKMSPRENAFVSFFIAGEGWHNFHHSFPSDYGAAELGNYSLNFAKLFIDLMAKIGWAYDLKTVSPEMVEKRMLRSGDKTGESTWGEAASNDICK